MVEVWPGTAYPLGATYDGTGTNFALFSEVAEQVELCLFDDDGAETRVELHRGRRLRLARLPAGRARASATATGCTAPYDPAAGCAATRPSCCSTRTRRPSTATIDWDQSLFGYDFGDPDSRNDDDSAPHMPQGVVINPFFDWDGDRRPDIPYNETRHLRGARQGPDPAAPRRPRGAARHVRRPRAPGDHRAPDAGSASPRSS